MRVARFDVNLAAGVVGEADAKLLVHRSFQLRIGICEDSHDVLEPGDQRRDLGCCQDPIGWPVPDLALDASPLAIDLGDPVTDNRRLGATLERRWLTSPAAPAERPLPRRR